MFLRVGILKLGINLVEYSSFIPKVFRIKINKNLRECLDKINAVPMVFFTDGDHPEKLNAAARYVLDNEQTKYLRIIHCYNQENEIPESLVQNLKTIDQIYPELRIDVLLCKLPFNASGIERLSWYLKVPTNYMFIGSPGQMSQKHISEFGGVRVIM